MSNLYVDRRGIEIRADGEALAFYENNERVGTVPMAPLSRVFLRGDVKFSASLLGKLGKHDIGVVILSGRKGEATLLMGRPHNDARLRLAQYGKAQNETACLYMARWLVREKLQSQKQLLRDHLERRPTHRYVLGLQIRRLDELLDKRLDLVSSISSLRGIEGAGAQAYFRALGKLFPDSLGFNGRNRRPPRDPANAVLSLGYTLLHNEAVLGLYGCGLDPFIGFYHQTSFSRESLACDIVEPMRTLIDELAVQVFARQTLRADHFTRSENGCLLGKAGRQHFYQEYNKLHETILRQLARRMDELKQRMAEVAPQVGEPEQDDGAENERLSDLL